MNPLKALRIYSIDYIYIIYNYDVLVCVHQYYRVKGVMQAALLQAYQPFGSKLFVNPTLLSLYGFSPSAVYPGLKPFKDL